MAPKVVIIILNWNRWSDTVECLNSVQHLTYSHYQIVIVDNGSTDDSLVKIKEWCEGKLEGNTGRQRFSSELKPLTYLEYDRETAKKGGITAEEEKLARLSSPRKAILIRAGDNLGFSEGNNIAIQYALNCAEPADFVFLLNNDTRIERDCVSRLVDVAGRTDSGVVGCVIKDIDGNETLFSGDHRRPELFYFPYLFFRHRLLHDEPSSIVWGTAMLIRRDALIAHQDLYGYFLNPELFLYMEDNELCIELKRMGFKIFIAKDAKVYHKKSERYVNQRIQNTFLHYYLTRNMTIIARQLLSGGWLLLFHVYHPLARLKDILVKFSSGRGREARAIWEGLIDGYANRKGKWRRHA